MSGSADQQWRRVRYFFQEPAVWLAVYASLDQASNRIAGCTPHVLSDAKGGAVTAVAHRVLG